MRYLEVLTPNIFNGYGTTETFWNSFLRPYDLPEYAGTVRWKLHRRRGARGQGL